VRNGPLSLYPLSVDEAVTIALNAGPMPAKKLKSKPTAPTPLIGEFEKRRRNQLELELEQDIATIEMFSELLATIKPEDARALIKDILWDVRQAKRKSKEF